MMDKEKVNEELRRIFGTGRVEKIKWGNNDENSQWNKWTLQEKLESCSSTSTRGEYTSKKRKR
jgi:hypothetical protein